MICALEGFIKDKGARLLRLSFNLSDDEDD